MKIGRFTSEISQTTARWKRVSRAASISAACPPPPPFGRSPPPRRLTSRGRKAKSFSRCVLHPSFANHDAHENDCLPRMIPKSGVRFSDEIMRTKKGGGAPIGAPAMVRAAQTGARSADRCAQRRQVRAICATHLLRGSGPYREPLAFRRSAAVLARANASAVGSAPVPAFPETRSGGRYPLRSVSSLPSSSETGRHAGRAVTRAARDQFRLSYRKFL